MFNLIQKGQFDAQEKKESSAKRELKALLDLYLSTKIKNSRTVLHLTDASAVEAIMQFGSPVKKLQDGNHNLQGL